MRGRTIDGKPLTPGHNVDRVDIERGLAEAKTIGFLANDEDRMVITYVLQRWQRGEESGAEASWMSHFGKHNYLGLRRVIAAAVAAGEQGASQ
jgi:hypothetical protein